jgi:hypothetical protein
MLATRALPGDVSTRFDAELAKNSDPYPATPAAKTFFYKTNPNLLTVKSINRHRTAMASDSECDIYRKTRVLVQNGSFSAKNPPLFSARTHLLRFRRLRCT